MASSVEKISSPIFWTVLPIIFALLIHNGTEPVFLLAFATIPLLIGLYLWKKSFWPLVMYLLVFGVFGRYTRYFRENYASDAILAIKDYIGYFLAGKNVYHEIVMAQSGPTPFTYLPFSLFWYLPATLFQIDLRYFEMLVSCIVPPLVFLYGYLQKKWEILSVTAVVSLTPFLLDLSADGSNDNSAVFLVLLSLVLLVWAERKHSIKRAVMSAICFGLALSFKHYVAFYALYFIPYMWHAKQSLGISVKQYLGVVLGTLGIVSLPFIIASPSGFFRSLFFIEIGNFHTTWGWNIWVALRDGLGILATKEQMWLVRTMATAGTIVIFFWRFRCTSLQRVLIAGSVTMLVYLILSNWTTYAYFTFLLPLLGMALLP